MFHKFLFIMAHEIGNTRFYPTYNHLMKNQWKSYDELKEDQENQLKKIIEYSYKYVPYYRKMFRQANLAAEDIRTIEDLEKLPVLTKETINKNWDEFIPANLNRQKYYTISTGGTTGTPMSYRLDNYTRFLNGAIMYRGWGFAGYELSDRMVYFGGGSLDISNTSRLTQSVHEIIRNIRKLSSFDMGDDEMRSYATIINKFKPKFLYGYPSSLFFFSKWIDANKIQIHHPEAVFSTSEKIYMEMREKIQDTFGCKVFDNYGLSDGGVTAHECDEHTGLHIDTEQSIMEVVDPDNLQLSRGEGKILATSLYNYSMPFIRYDTGDYADITEDTCSCGRHYPLLREIKGRSVDILITPEGKSVHGWFFLYIFWSFSKNIRQYQVIQETIDKIVIKIIPEENFDDRILEKISEIVAAKSKKWQIEYQIVEKIDTTQGGKNKFIINKIIPR